VDSRRLVNLVFEGGDPPRIPLHIESDDKSLEARLGDIVGAGAKITEWRGFYRGGGPFHRRKGESLGEWVDRVRDDEYEWPDPSLVVERAVHEFEKRVKICGENRYIMFKVLGPTETAEAFFTKPLDKKYEGQLRHGFDFGVFYSLHSTVASRIYERIARYIMELLKAGSELNYVDGIRVADDAATYTSLIYPRSFYDKLYIPWHRRFAIAIKRRSKHAVIHCDGDIRREGLLEHLAEIYDGLHPLDVTPKSTVRAAIEWARSIPSLRERARSMVFFTGLPIDLLFNNHIAERDFLKIPLALLAAHGSRWLVLATTHSEYPGRSYLEDSVAAKINIVRKALARCL